MKRIHMAHEPFTLTRMTTVQYTHYQPKPNGLWYARDMEWVKWCMDNRFGAYNKPKATLYEVTHKANVLQLRDTQDMNEFSKVFGEHTGLRMGVNWAAVADNYDGIEIMDYLWECRSYNEYLWYYSWDVGSGCIWNLDTVEIKPIGELILIHRDMELCTIRNGTLTGPSSEVTNTPTP